MAARSAPHARRCAKSVRSASIARRSGFNPLGFGFAASLAMKRKLTTTERLLLNEPPIAWVRAALAGMLSAGMMMALIDTFNMLCVTAFSFERFVGSTILGRADGTHVWTVGLVVN